MNSTLLITSKLTNQRAQKALLTCVIYTNIKYYDHFFSSGDKPTAAAPPFVFVAPVKQGTTTDIASALPGDQQRDKGALGVSDITFVSESQPESNNARQRKKPRRRKAPIYWGKKPSRRKSEVKRKLDSELDLVNAGCVENGEPAESDTEDVPGNSEGDRSADEETEKVHDVNSDEENATDQDEEDDVELMENGVSSVNGDVVLLETNNPGSELNNDDLNSESVLQNELENASHLPEGTLKNHVLYEKVSSLPNGISPDGFSEEKECDVEHIGENISNSIKKETIIRFSPPPPPPCSVTSRKFKQSQ